MTFDERYQEDRDMDRQERVHKLRRSFNDRQIAMAPAMDEPPALICIRCGQVDCACDCL